MAYAFNQDKSKYDLSDVVYEADIADVVRDTDIADVVRDADIADVVREADIDNVVYETDLYGNEFDRFINIKSYLTIQHSGGAATAYYSGSYTFPSDGYLHIAISGESTVVNGSYRIVGPNQPSLTSLPASPEAYGRSVVFVKKGMALDCTGFSIVPGNADVTIEFAPLKLNQ